MGYDEDFKGKRALVTGGSRGIGRAIAESLLSHGADVTVVGRNPQNLATLRQSHPTIKTICVDLSDWEKTSEILTIATSTTSQPAFDILVNNAGIFIPHTFLDTTPSIFNSIIATNLSSIFSVSQIVVKAMIAGGVAGAIVNISSLASIRVLPFMPVYAASKAGVDMVTKCMAVELGSHGIRVNSVNCAGVDKDMARDPGNAEFYKEHWKEGDDADYARRQEDPTGWGCHGGDGAGCGGDPVFAIE